MKKLIIVLCFILWSCATTQKPAVETPVYQITDNSQITLVLGDNNKTTPTASPKTTAEPQVEQTADQTTKNDTSWLLGLILLVFVCAGIGVWYYYKKIKKI